MVCGSADERKRSSDGRRFVTVPDVIPSLYAADHGAVVDAAQMLYGAGARQFHIDVMDGVLVPALGLSFGTIESVKRALPDAILHVHLMTSRPSAHALCAMDAGADSVTFHLEATMYPEEIAASIQGRGKSAGVALNPATAPAQLKYLSPALDSILVMTASPGHNQPTFLPMALSKIADIRLIAPDAVLVADGQIDLSNVQSVRSAGVDFAVCGGAIFNNDPLRAYSQLREAWSGIPR